MKIKKKNGVGNIRLRNLQQRIQRIAKRKNSPKTKRPTPNVVVHTFSTRIIIIIIVAKYDIYERGHTQCEREREGECISIIRVI